jgi:acetyl-CoA C-acetyltransferase
VGLKDEENEKIELNIDKVFEVKKMMERCGVKKDDVEMWEVNEELSVVVLEFIKYMNIEKRKKNVNGGDVRLGKKIGMYGERIVLHIVNEIKKGEKGVDEV